VVLASWGHMQLTAGGPGQQLAAVPAQLTDQPDSFCSCCAYCVCLLSPATLPMNCSLLCSRW
jgi:hypothetical protein